MQGSDFLGTGRATTDQGEAGGTRKPGGAIRQKVSGGAEGGRSHRIRERRWSHRILLLR